MKKVAVIIGGGPAGLTAAYELLQQTDIHPVILEQTQSFGGISQTVCHHGNRMDIGGHRFFSKSDRVNAWWMKMLEKQGAPARDELALGLEPVGLEPDGADPEKVDRVFLLRRRISRILYLRKFFDYPISLSAQTISNLGIVRTFSIGLSYFFARVRPIRPEESLEDFLINRFGKTLYQTFFRDYTEKVWGIPCSEISSAWGAQRIKGLSISKAIAHAARKALPKAWTQGGKTETSLIEQFVYPKFGPGQLWETVAEKVREMGGEIYLGTRVDKLENEGDRIQRVSATQLSGGSVQEFQADYVISSMPLREFAAALSTPPPMEVNEVACGLQYRDFITVGLLLKKLAISNKTQIRTVNNLIPDNWIYIQENDVRVGRVQIFNNWSPYLVKDPDTVWIGLEYFCNEGDDLWEMGEEEMIQFAISEMEKIGFLRGADVLDSVRIKMPKAYPAYFGTYAQFDVLREYLDGYTNLFPVGRNGMHRYNNMDHSMLTAMAAVENIKQGRTENENIWNINEEKEYHESSSSS